MPGEGVFLLSERDHFLLRGAAYVHLVPCLDGRRTVDEIVTQLAGTVPAREVVFALDRMIAAGYATLDPAADGSRRTAFLDVVRGGDRLPTEATRTVAVRTVGDVDSGVLLRLLAESGIAVTDEGDLDVVLTTDHLHPDLGRINHRSLEDKRPWLLVKPVGLEVWLGPLFLPGRTGCWECLAHRLRGHRRVEGFVAERLGREPSFALSRAALASTVQAALSLTVTEIERWAGTGRSESLQGAVVTLDTTALQTRRHGLVRRPQCSACGDSERFSEPSSGDITLRSRRKVSGPGNGDGHRTVRPRETLERYGHHVSPVTGIVRSLQSNAPDPDGPALSYVTDHSFAHLNDDLWFLRESLRSRSGGKGTDPQQARASALCEAIERYSGVFHGDEPRVRARLTELGDQAVHPNACMRFSDRQYRERDRWNASGSVYNWVPEPFAQDAEVEWTPLWSLAEGRTRYLPTAYCYYGYARETGVSFARADSNGCAAGNNLEEAVLQGFLELIERDAVALWWYNRVRRPRVDVASFGDPWMDRLIEYYETLHRDLWVLDITNDLEIPVFAAISRRNDKDTEDLIMGFGAHLDAQAAIVRSLTELNQSLPDVFHGTPDPDGTHLPSDRPAVEWLNTATIRNQPYLPADPSARPTTEATHRRVRHDDVLDDISECLEIAKASGLDVLVLDQTRPDVGLPVVKVVVPGLRSFWARFAPGRLYRVPVELGWIGEPLDETALNPTPLFF